MVGSKLFYVIGKQLKKDTILVSKPWFLIDELIEGVSVGLAKASSLIWKPFYHGVGDHLFETPISTDQVLVELGNGKLSLKATVADTQQLAWWMLGLGDGVELAKPSELRKRIASTIEKMSQLYR